MSNRSNGKKRKGKFRLNILQLTMAVIMIFMLVWVGLEVKNIVVLHMENSRLVEEKERLTAEKNSKRNELKGVKDLDYMEEQARRHLKMIKPGEVLYILDDSDSSSKNGNTEEHN